MRVETSGTIGSSNLLFRGSVSDIPPLSAKEIMDNPNAVFGELVDAGTSTFQKSSRNELLRQLDERKPEAPKFKAVTRLGGTVEPLFSLRKSLASPARPSSPRSGISINSSSPTSKGARGAVKSSGDEFSRDRVEQRKSL